jgi:hypothetical protein
MAMHLVVKYLEEHRGVGFTVEQLAAVFGESEQSMRNKVSRMRQHPAYREKFTTFYRKESGTERAYLACGEELPGRTL